MFIKPGTLQTQEGRVGTSLDVPRVPGNPWDTLDMGLESGSRVGTSWDVPKVPGNP